MLYRPRNAATEDSKIGTIPYNWMIGSYSQNRNYFLQGYVTLKFRPSERMIIDLVSWKF